VPKVSETLLSLRLLQSTHEPSLLLLPTLPGKLLRKKHNLRNEMKNPRKKLIVFKQKQRIVINEWGEKAAALDLPLSSNTSALF
jgi:hypothetical protein